MTTSTQTPRLFDALLFSDSKGIEHMTADEIDRVEEAQLAEVDPDRFVTEADLDRETDDPDEIEWTNEMVADLRDQWIEDTWARE